MEEEQVVVVEEGRQEGEVWSDSSQPEGSGGRINRDKPSDRRIMIDSML